MARRLKKGKIFSLSSIRQSQTSIYQTKMKRSTVIKTDINSPNTNGSPKSSRPPVVLARQHTNKLIPGSIYSLTLLAFFDIVMLKRNLVSSPIQCMIETIPLVVILQAGYCVLAKLARPKKTKKGSEEYPSVGSQLSSVVLSTILSLILSALVFVLLILFGAPMASLTMETALCAIHISLLSVLPMVYVYNLDANTWRDIISVKLPLNSVYAATVGTWLGAWLGAIPIPLDWDRPWQRWPVTILAGAYLGTAVGTIVGGISASFKKKKN